MKILVTGGAGFIGSHLVDALLVEGCQVRVYDNLDPQVHGGLRERGEWPTYLDPEVERILGDVRDQDALAAALRDVDIVFHLAAATGVGQSMYQIAKYSAVNVQGTANLLDVLANGSHQVRRLILASSRAVYGEGAYHCPRCGPVYPGLRTPAQLDRKQWDILCPHCSVPAKPVPTSESNPANPGSMYGIGKLAQEQMVRCFGRAYGLSTMALRFFNVYGPRQSLSNPYAGLIGAFTARLVNRLPPEVYEDGLMTRDFVHVSDAVRACLLALEQDQAEGAIFNIGSGRATAILELAELLSRQIAANIDPQVVGMARVGDIRHCTADLTAADARLDYRPQVTLEQGLAGLVAYLRNKDVQDRSSQAKRELECAGLLR